MTKALYLEDTYLFESSAVILKELETDKGHALILDQTIFYPQGGGQPADHGTIAYLKAVYHVTDTRLNDEGEVLHYGTWQGERAQTGSSVSLSINQERRILNARNHSAGHLLYIAMDSLGYHFPHSRSYHFADSPYVEYFGSLENTDEVKDLLNQETQNLIQANIPVHKEILSPKQCKQKEISIPAGKEGRTITFAGYKEVGCGGTHISHSGEVGGMQITKISSKKGIVRISYKLL
ncbi:MAG: alanine--tRNA ligase-related protein [Candidatus Gracilibacteria bacterium]